MPNWTWNKITCKKSLGDKLIEKTEDGYKFDFNKIIPMPSSLRITAGSIEEKSVASYYLSLNESEQKELQNNLKKKELTFYGTYWDKYKRDINEYIENPDKLKNERETFNGGSEEVDSKIKDINELGKLYIDNINNYGDSQWYHWCNKNWGTKWNVSEDVEVDYDDSAEEYNICFNTAWCPPYGIIDKYSEMCNDGEFDWEYENEDYDGHHYITKENGELIERVVDEPDYDTDDDMEI